MCQIPQSRAAIIYTMKQETFIALEGVIQKLFESAVNNVQDVINETEDLEFFDSDKLMQEADYIDNLQRVKGTLDDAKENDEIESFEPNLKFLKGDFTAPDLVDMLGEENASEVSYVKTTRKTDPAAALPPLGARLRGSRREERGRGSSAPLL